MRALRLFFTAAIGVALVPLAAGAASAAPPSNDEATGAIAINVGDDVQQDTTQATTNAGDDALNANCGAPATEASVWYVYTPSTKTKSVLDATASDYSVGLMVFDGTPTADSLVTCGPGEVGLRARAGHTYYIMAFSDTAGVIGGNLDLAMKNAPTPHAHVTVAKRGVAYHGGAGAAKIHGTYSCTHNDSFSFIDARLEQRAGRLKIRSEGGTHARCDGQRHRWSTRLVSPVGTYAAGHARATVKIIVCGFIQCARDKVERRVHLAWASGAHRPVLHSDTVRMPQARPLIARERHWPTR
ncbi:MAG TPA: DUF6299 family protein [Nocardioides sp.]|jgi:hypothetical protein|nr:DUF6299 family protein [Nocardioides sp.]